MIIKKLPFSKCIHYVKVLKYGVFSGLNAEKYGPEKTQYVDTSGSGRCLKSKSISLRKCYVSQSNAFTN